MTVSITGAVTVSVTDFLFFDLPPRLLGKSLGHTKITDCPPFVRPVARRVFGVTIRQAK